MSSVNTDTSYRDWLSNQTSGTSSSSGTGKTYNAVFVDEEDTGLKVDDFLNLMVTQLKNQDFLNPVDDTQYVAQMAQFASLQQMKEMAEYSKTSYAMSLVGKNVTAAKYSVSGKLDKVTGVITKVSLVDNEYKIFIGDKSFSLSQIMEVNNTTSTTDPEKTGDSGKTGDSDKTSDSGKTSDSDKTNDPEKTSGPEQTDNTEQTGAENTENQTGDDTGI